MNATDTSRDAIVLFERQPLADALATVLRVVEKRNTIPILSMVIVEPFGAGARLYATDLDCAVSVELPAAWEEAGAFAVDAARLADAVAKCSADDVTMRQDGGRLALASGRASFSLELRPAPDMPRLAPAADRRDAIGFDVPATDWRALMLDANRFAGRDEVRYYLKGINLAVDAGELIAAATNGHGLFVRRLGMPAAAEMLATLAPRGFIMPSKACALAGRIIRRDAIGAASLQFFRYGRSGSEAFELRHGAVTIISKAIDGSFPDWRRVVPGDDKRAQLAGIWTVPAGELTAFAKGAAAGVRKVSAALRFADKVRACVTVEGRASHSAAPGEYIGDAVTTGASLPYLADVAAAFDKGAALDVAVYPPATKRDQSDAVPFVVTSAAAPADTIVLMPVRIAWEEPAAPSLPIAAPAAPGAAASLFDVVPMVGMLKGQDGADVLANMNGPRTAQPGEVAAYLRDYASRCGFPALECTRILMTGPLDPAVGATFGEVTAPAVSEMLRVWDDAAGAAVDKRLDRPEQYEDGAYSVPMPHRRAFPVVVEQLDEAGAVVSCEEVRTDGKGALAIGAAAVAALTGLSPVKATRAKRQPAAKAVEAPAAQPKRQPRKLAAAVPPVVEEAAQPAPEVHQDVAPAAQDVAPQAPDVAALVATVEALAARVASLEARPDVPTAAAPAARMRAPEAVRRRLVAAYLRQRAARRFAEETAAAGAKAAWDNAAAQARFNTTRGEVLERQRAEIAALTASLDRATARRRATAALLVNARRSLAAAKRHASDNASRARQAETALAGAQLASAAAWERVAALQLDAGTPVGPRLAVAA